MFSGKTKKGSKSTITGLKMSFQTADVPQSNSIKNTIPFSFCNNKHEELSSDML